jgi:isocitrate lyase
MELANNLFNKKRDELSNRLNESKAIGAMARAAREEDDHAEEFEEREEAKEEEYDYFLDNVADENAGGAQGYHIVDENDL